MDYLIWTLWGYFGLDFYLAMIQINFGTSLIQNERSCVFNFKMTLVLGSLPQENLIMVLQNLCG